MKCFFLFVRYRRRHRRVQRGHSSGGGYGYPSAAPVGGPAGGLLGKMGGLGTVLGAATMGTALLNPVSSLQSKTQFQHATKEL